MYSFFLEILVVWFGLALRRQVPKQKPGTLAHTVHAECKLDQALTSKLFMSEGAHSYPVYSGSKMEQGIDEPLLYFVKSEVAKQDGTFGNHVATVNLRTSCARIAWQTTARFGPQT